MHILSPGMRIGQYEIASRPMMGGMGVVYFALDHGNDGHPVALKTFRPELLPNRVARDRFLREGIAWVELGNHPHIVRCYKVEYIDPTAFLVLELIAKEQNMPDASLRSWLIPGHPLPLEQALLFALQIARGMQHATEKIPGFVHRDLKPENILVGADRLPSVNINRLRVTDFGLATILKDEIGKINYKSGTENLKRIQLTHGIVGTPLYMAPEQWKSEPVGVFTDIYAFGCITYEMLSGQYAVNGQTISDLQVSHCDGHLQPLPLNLPKDMDALLAKCLATDPSQRYENWGELIEEIERVYSKQSGVSAPRVEGTAEFSCEEHVQMGWSYNAMGYAYADIGNSEMAAVYFEKVLGTMRKLGNRLGEGTALGNLGSAYLNLGDARRAIGYYEQYLGITHEINDRHGEGTALGNMGNSFFQLGDVQRAIDYYEQHLAITQEIGDLRGAANVLNSLGIAYKNFGDKQRAIDYYEQSLAIYRELSDRHGEGAALGNLGNIHLELGDVKRAISYHEKRLTIAREIGDRRGEGTVSGNLGNAYEELGEIKRAIDCYKQHLAITREVGDRRGEGNALGNLGNINMRLGDVRQAISYYQQSLELYREIGNRRGEGLSLGNLGRAYQTLGDTQLSISNYEQALVVDREIGSLDSVARHLFNMANLYAQQKNLTRALSLAQEAAQIWSQTGSPNAQRAKLMIAKLQGGDASALPNLVEAAFEAFQRAANPEVMQIVVGQYSFMADDEFIHAVEEIINEKIPPNLKPAFEQRLNWLKQIAKK